MTRISKEKGQTSSCKSSAAHSRSEVIADIEEILTLLTELQHEPEGGGRHVAAHSLKLAQLVHTLHQEVECLKGKERQECDSNLKAILNLSVDGKGGKTLGSYLKDHQSQDWGKDYSSNWQHTQHREAMVKEIHNLLHSMQKSLHKNKCCN